MKIFFAQPSREFGVREAAKLLEVAPATASKDLSELAEKGILKVREDRRTILYSANLDNDLYRDLKIFNTIKSLKEKGLVASLNKFYNNPSIVLFGSAAQGIDKEISDINLLIVSNKNEIFTEKENFEKLFERKIQLIVVGSLSEMNNKELSKDIVNGKIIQGELIW